MQKLVWQNTNGDVIDLTSGNYAITEWEGFANTTLNIQSQQVPFQDGGVFLDALMEQRELSVTLAIQDNNDLEARYRMRRELTHILNPKLGEGYLIYTNDFISKRIKCVPQIPLFETHNSNTSGTPKASLAWTACEPYWEDVEETVISLDSGIRKIIENEGDVPVGLKIDIFSNSVTNPEFRNLSSNKFIKLLGEFESGIHINTNSGEKSIVSEKMTFNISEISANIQGLVYAKRLGMFVMVAGLTVLTSTDGVNWECQSALIKGEKLVAITYSESLGLFVAVSLNFADATNISISSNGKNWTSSSHTYVLETKDVLYCEDLGKFIAVGYNEDFSDGRVLISTDGTDWDVFGNISDYSLNAITYSKRLGILVLVGNNGLIMTSTDGETWTEQTSGISANLFGVCYSKKLEMFVATGADGTILTSTDGETWEEQESGISEDLGNVIFADDLEMFETVGEGGTILASYNGIYWTDYSVETSFNLNKIARSEDLGLFIIGGNYGFISQSTDGKTWILPTSQITQNYNKITYSEKLGLFVIVGNGGAIATSKDSNTWILRNGGISNKLTSITYSEELNLFVAVGEHGVIITSNNGINWENHSVNSQYNFNDVIYCDELNMFVAVGNCHISYDGINWTNINLDIMWGSIVYSHKLHRFVIVAYSNQTGYFYTYISSDGINWTRQESQNLRYDYFFVNDIEFSEELNLFVAVGRRRKVGDLLYSVIWISPDGINWEEQKEYNYSNFGDIVCITYSQSLNLFLARSENGYVIASSDGKVWVSYGVFGTATADVIYSERLDMFVMCGDGILKSDFSLFENLISDLSSKSDMTLGLEMGRNDFLISRDAGFLNAKVKYRQKYIGV